MIDYDEVLGKKKKKAPPSNSLMVPLDVSVVKPGFLKFETEVARWEKEASALEVKDDDSRKMAVMIGGEATKLAKQIDTQRNEIWRPYLDFRKKLDTFVATYTDRLINLVAAMKAKERTYLALQEMKRREAERIALDEMAKIQEKINKEAEEKKIEPVTLEAPVIPVQKVITRTETGTTSYEHRQWKGEVIEGKEDLVGRHLCSPDHKKIKDAVAGGLREGMPGSEGLHIWEDVGQRYRT